MSKRLSRSSKTVAHHSPGRTRLKVPKSHRAHLHKIEEALASKPGVTHVELNHQTGSVLVHHEHDLPIFDVLHEAAEHVGADLLSTLIEGESLELFGGVGIVAAAVGVLGTVGETIFGRSTSNSKSALLTGSSADLKTIVPVAFLLAAVYKAYQTRSFWHGLTPLALTYWAFDTYWRFNIANPGVFEPQNGKVKEHVQN